MNKNMPIRGLIERKLEDPKYRKEHDERYAAFKLEVQILVALEAKGWTYAKLARALHTNKSNISRDLKAGGISKASFARIHRIADALDMKLLAILVPKDEGRSLLQKIEEHFQTLALKNNNVKLPPAA